MELYRNGLKLTATIGLDESRGSVNVPVRLLHNEKDKYLNYTEQIHIRYLFDNQVKEEILPTNDNGFYIPGKPLSHDGPIELAVHLINGDIELVTNELSFIVKNAPNGTTQVDPSEFTWQQLVDQYVNAKLDTFANKLDLSKFEETVNGSIENQSQNIESFKTEVNANLSNQDKKITDLQVSTKSTLDSQNTKINDAYSTQNSKIATLESRMNTFTSLEEGSTTGDAELQDIRVGANGTTYDTAGNAVRCQYIQLKEDLDELNKDIFSNITSLNLSSVFTDITNVNRDIPDDWVSLWSRQCYPTDNHKLIKHIEINSPKGGSVTLYKAKLNTDNTATILAEESFTLIKGVNIVKPSTHWIVKAEQDETIMLKSNSLGSYGYDTTDTGLSLRYFPSNHKLGKEKVYGAFNVYFTELSSKLKFNNIIIVSKEHGDYETVTDAVKHANNGDLVYIKNGIYENEIIEAWGKDISIVGENKYKTVIENTTGTYSTPALEMSVGLLSNVTIYAKNKGVVSKDSNGWSDYAVHVEHDSLFNNTLYIDNVILKSDEQSAIGVGTRGNSTLEFNNCEFYSDSTFAVWLHDTTSTDTKGETNVKFKNCIAYTSTGNTIIRIGAQRVEGQHTNLTFVNNVFCTASGKNQVYKTPDYNTGSVTTDDGNFGLIGYDKTILCFGNNINDLNFN